MACPEMNGHQPAYQPDSSASAPSTTAMLRLVVRARTTAGTISTGNAGSGGRIIIVTWECDPATTTNIAAAKTTSTHGTRLSAARIVNTTNPARNSTVSTRIGVVGPSPS